jgi:molybdopterin-guanine dinucleotide biosynthesis protein A
VCVELVVVIAPSSIPPPLPVGVEARVVRDDEEGQGPLAGALAGLASTTTEWALLAGGDMPEPATAVLLEMLRVAAEAPVDAVALREGDRTRPLPSVLRPAAAVPNAHDLLHAGERRLRALLDSLRVAAIDEVTWTALDPAHRTMFDVDEPADLRG